MFLTSQTTCHYQVVPLHMLACYLYRTDPLLASGTVVFSVAAADHLTTSHTVRKDNATIHNCNGPARSEKTHAVVKLWLFDHAVRKDTRDQAMPRPGAAARSEKTHATVKLRLFGRAVRKDTRDRAVLPSVRPCGQKRHTRTQRQHTKCICVGGITF